MSEQHRGEQTEIGIEEIKGDKKRELLVILRELKEFQEKTDKELNEASKTLGKDDVQKLYGRLSPRLQDLRKKAAEARNAWLDAVWKEYERSKEMKVPSGTYQLQISFAHRSGDTKKLIEKIQAGREHGIEDLAALEKEARSLISALGLHNFGAAFDETQAAEVSFTLSNPENPEISFFSSCIIDVNGHLARK